MTVWRITRVQRTRMGSEHRHTIAETYPSETAANAVVRRYGWTDAIVEPCPAPNTDAARFAVECGRGEG
jgi:hypothetical protein